MKNSRLRKKITISYPSAANTKQWASTKHQALLKPLLQIAFVCSFILLATTNLNAQVLRELTGTVFTKTSKNKTEYLSGAVVAIPKLGIGTTTGDDGKFSLSVPDSATYLVVSYIGYTTDTQTLRPGQNTLNIELLKPHNLKEVTVREKLKTTEIGLLSTIKTERIGQAELYKAACCNLSQSFETTPSVDVSFTDAVTGYKTIRLLGLAGPYTLITQENIPEVRGLASISGLTFTPGSWIEGMQLSKGSGSVVNGYESVAGQINVELKKPFAGEKLFVNVYQSSQGGTEAGAIYRHSFNPNLGTMLFVDATSQWLKVDLNNDRFVDQPLGNQINLLNRWIYTNNNGFMVQAGIKVYYQKGIGGDMDYKEGGPQTIGNPWGYVSTTKRLEDWAKIAKVFTGREETSIGLQLSNTNHDQNSMYGLNTYQGTQNSFYANLIYQNYIKNLKHIIKVGASEVLDVYNEQLTQTTIQQTYNRTESVPGVFAEYSGNFSDKFNMVAGLRADYDNYYGAFVTPRLHLRYAPFKKTAIRASVGRAQRTANIFADNIGYLASNRQIVIKDPLPNVPYGLSPEVAWNTGMNLTQKFKFRYHEGVISLDYYYTQFQNQVVVDINYPQVLNFYNLNGLSYAHSFQAQFDYELLRKLNLRLAYRYYNVMVTYNELGLQEKPFVPPHRAFINLGYETKNKWKFDCTGQWLSSQRTPFANNHNHGGSGSGLFSYSPAYYQLNAQITKVFSETFEAYLGGDNLTNYMQHDAIIAYADPYSRNFDASMIWGPMMGVNVYLGIRYKIK